MTSPAQLKYLDAMGIPVWVSRDIVIKQNVIGIKPEVSSNTKDTAFTKSVSSKASNESSTSNESSNNTAQSIINSLGQSQSNKSKLKEVVTNSVENATIPPELSEPNHQQAIGENLVYKSAQHYVFASGNESADWMVIGHSPEPFNGIGNEPFAGEAGELLVNMIRAVGIAHPRQQAYFVNVLDLDRNQEKSSQNDSKINLNKQIVSLIEKVNPKLVLIVGQIAAQNLLDITDPLIIMRSKVHRVTDKKLPCIVTYYPSYLLQKPIDKRKAWNDLKLAMCEITNVS